MNWSLTNPRWHHFLWQQTIGRRKKSLLSSIWGQVLQLWKLQFWKILFSERTRNYSMYSIFLMRDLSLLNTPARQKRLMAGNILHAQTPKECPQNRLSSVEPRGNFITI